MRAGINSVYLGESLRWVTRNWQTMLSYGGCSVRHWRIREGFYHAKDLFVSLHFISLHLRHIRHEICSHNLELNSFNESCNCKITSGPTLKKSIPCCNPTLQSFRRALLSAWRKNLLILLPVCCASINVWILWRVLHRKVFSHKPAGIDPRWVLHELPDMIEYVQR